MMEKILINPSKERTIIDFRKYGFNDVLVLGRYIYRATHPPLELHNQQDLLEFSFLAQGRQTFCIENEIYLVKGGEIIAIYPHETHGSGIYGEEKGIMYWMLINPPTNKGSFLGTSKKEGQLLWNSLLTIPNRVFTASPNAQKNLEAIFKIVSQMSHDDVSNSDLDDLELLNSNEKKGDSKKLYLHQPDDFSSNLYYTKSKSHLSSKNIFEILKIRSLLLLYLLDIVQGGNKQPRSKSEKVQLLIDWFEEHTDQMLSIKEMAQLVKISVPSLIKKFKTELGVTPGDYQMRYKIEYSLHMLRDESMSITDIAYELGFSSSQYFATVFKRYMLISPTTYRNKN